MNEPRYNHFWLYVLDMHNHHAIGDVRHAVNPTSPYRMQKIVEEAVAAQKEAAVQRDEAAQRDAAEKNSSEGDELAALLCGMEINNGSERQVDKNQFCSCTRKCATKKCSCYLSNTICNELCHKSNNSCTNYE